MSMNGIIIKQVLLENELDDRNQEMGHHDGGGTMLYYRKLKKQSHKRKKTKRKNRKKTKRMKTKRKKTKRKKTKRKYN